MNHERRAWPARQGRLAGKIGPLAALGLGMTFWAAPASAAEPPGPPVATVPAPAPAAPAVQTLPARPKPFAYGILIGSNRGGPGQNPLHYAGEDARKMAAVL